MSSNMNMKAVELLFQRPLEPIFTSRDNGKAAFDLPDSYFTERFSGIGVELQSRFGDNVELKIPVREISKPNLEFTKKIRMKQQFCLFSNQHKKIAGELIKLFLDEEDLTKFISIAAYTKDRVNPFLFQYALSVAIQHRPDTANIMLPPIAETFPANFVEPSVLKDARAEASIITNPGDRMRIDIPQNYTASDREVEQRLAYFREDIGVNMHHWHWHLVYPTEGPREVVAKDRRGELFYYMHHQIIARYNIERFGAGLGKVVPLSNLREAIPEGYFPKIISSVSNRTYPARVANLALRDVNREENRIEIADCERWSARILAAIDQGFVFDPAGKQVPLDEVRGIDMLGDMMEATSLSINPQLYGNLHNMGHVMIAYSHDPDFRYLEDFGVIADVTTAMRDPAFYRWHTFIDGIFGKHKSLLTPYTTQQLSFTDVNVDSAQVIISSPNTKPNVLVTYWQKSDVDLAAALDFGPNGNVYARFVHLQHAPFEYTINVTNASDAPRKGTCRIFICPKTDESGTALKMDEQRLLVIDLDKFTIDLQPGANTIKRRSSESSITIPFERTFRRIGPAFQPTDAKQLATFRFCGCGWPQHLLLPKGKAGGMAFDLFVMISDYAGDEVIQPNMNPEECGKAASTFCGLKDKLYPDKRAMGYPFDRKLTADNLDALASTYSNMFKTDITIIFEDRIIEKEMERM